MHPVTSVFPSFFLVSPSLHPLLSLANLHGLFSFYCEHETALGLEALSSFPASRNFLVVFLHGRANNCFGAWPPHLTPKRNENSEFFGKFKQGHILHKRSACFWFTVTICSQKGLTNCFVFWNHHITKDGKSLEKDGRRLVPG